MTSVTSYIAQIPPFSFYIVENNDGYMINPTFTAFIELDGNTVLADMGKTIVRDGFIYRKVQVTSYNGELISAGETGYICLNSDTITIPDVGTENQGVSKIN